MRRDQGSCTSVAMPVNPGLDGFHFLQWFDDLFFQSVLVSQLPDVVHGDNCLESDSLLLFCADLQVRVDA